MKIKGLVLLVMTMTLAMFVFGQQPVQVQDVGGQRYQTTSVYIKEANTTVVYRTDTLTGETWMSMPSADSTAFVKVSEPMTQREVPPAKADSFVPDREAR